MNVLILNGCDPTCGWADGEQARWEQAGAKVARHDLSGERVAFCQGCFECWVKTPGICKTGDVARRIAEEWVKSDVAVLVTPISFGGYGSQLKKAVDRMIGIVSPFFAVINGETHHQPRYDRYPALAAIGFLSEPDEEQAEIFHQLVAHNATNMHAPAHRAEVVLRARASEIQGCSLMLGKAGNTARAS